MSGILAVVFLIIIASVNAMTARAQTVPVKVGDVAPGFTLVDHRGNKLTLSDSRGKSPVVIVFYRGYW